ncbi:error-prone DNA polymerase [Paracraurococcus ruber]|uniref:Error-prone DNA polymerase n=1 Tax=Paracraurococcus ruber TaxID=77675 RepID=A0ABS1CZP7_9PROT|nr:error-prone DNA polymerase [Paracraurococcus ruber]MBK1659497.1 error-prone DNA polymerase [Paracraurococcus ruber]TDG27188.1 DNA polymerase III subunit alpha [Paracraurococcus ruber]
MTRFSELAALSNFTFLDGASHPQELVAQARALGHAALGIADRNSFAGLVRGWVAAKKEGLRFVPGARVTLLDGTEYLAWPTDRAAYGRLSHLLSLGRMEAPKGECHVARDALVEAAEGLVLALVPPDTPDDAFADRLRRDAAALRRRLALPLFCAASHRFRGDDRKRLDRLAALGAPLLAAGGTRYHVLDRRRLADVLAAIRLGTTVDALGYAAEQNAEAHLKPAEEMLRLFAGHEDAVEATQRVVDACRFSLDDLAYDYPDEILDPGLTPQQTLEKRTWEAAAGKWPQGVPDKVAAQLRYELRLIAGMDYAPYFLTVHEIVRFAVGEGILCQGRGSAANSAVCYVLGITSVAPDKHDLLFERFISASRNEPPDIDVDFEHERREEVIQHIYRRYGRDRAAIAATVIRYRDRSAIREVGKAMGLSEDVTGRLAKSVWGAGGSSIAEIAQDQGLDPEGDPRLRLACALTEELLDFPRHLATHVGGFVITRGKLTELAIVTKAAMADRHTIEWDKDDIEALRILKVDVLGLGMLSCIRRAFDLIAHHRGPALTLQAVPQDCPETYAMLRRADSLGVFQVESRAQMNMLPRLRPDKFYDLVIEVAIVRPGPIQGDMVHPYLRRKNRQEDVTYPSPELEKVLYKTLGVPLFQEQAMQIAIVGAGFTPARADELRRAMATFRHVGTIWQFQQEFIAGMVRNGVSEKFAERCFRQIEGFGTYGFPESHAAAFAQLVYVSAWIKRHHPAAFACALLNSQPMGFYAPAQIVRDAREHGVAIRPADVLHSDWDCTLEPDARSTGGLALRLGLRLVQGMGEAAARRIVAARAAQEDDPARAAQEDDPARAAREDDPAGAAREDDPAGAAREDDPAGAAREDDPAGATRQADPAMPAWADAPAPAGRARNAAPAAPGETPAGKAAPDPAMMHAAPVPSLPDLVRRAALDRGTVERLAEADAFRSLGLDRRAALWEAAAVEKPAAQPAAAVSLPQGDLFETPPSLPAATAGEQTVLDYTSTGLSLRRHPLALLRPILAAEGLADTRMLDAARRGAWLRLPGLVLVRQRPGSAKGVVFFTVEDEWGVANLVVYPDLARRFRAAVVAARLVVAEGRVERHEAAVPIIHLIVRRLLDRSELLAGLAALDAPKAGAGSAGDAPWRRALARADEVAKPDRPDARTLPRDGNPRLKLPPSRDFH